MAGDRPPLSVASQPDGPEPGFQQKRSILFWKKWLDEVLNDFQEAYRCMAFDLEDLQEGAENHQSLAT